MLPDEELHALALDALPKLPQCLRLRHVAHGLWERGGVLALWLGGSLARGEGDLYSDIDLRVAVDPSALEAWKQPDFVRLFQGGCLAQLFLPFGEDAFLHHLLLDTGDIYDLWVQSAQRPPYEEAILILGCRDMALAERLQRIVPPVLNSDPPAEKEAVCQLLVEFWITSHKHRKVLYRNLHLLALTGVQLDRACLQRLWYIQATGKDYGSSGSQTIHSLTERMRIVEQAMGAAALEVLGTCLTNREEIYQAIEQVRDEVSKVGKQLAERMGFEYLHALEQTVRQGWKEFIERSAR